MTEELPPVRCITCNKVLGHYWQRYQRLLDQGVSIQDALDQLGLNRYCCRMRMMNPAKIVSSQPMDLFTDEIPQDVSYRKAPSIKKREERNEGIEELESGMTNLSLTKRKGKSAVEANIAPRNLSTKNKPNDNLAKEYRLPTQQALPALNTTIKTPEETVVLPEVPTLPTKTNTTTRRKHIAW